MIRRGHSESESERENSTSNKSNNSKNEILEITHIEILITCELRLFEGVSCDLESQLPSHPLQQNLSRIVD